MNKGFAPIIDNNSRVLILGTFPSPISRSINEYYGNNKNKFWELIKDIFNDGINFKDYNDKKNCLIKNNIALWDIVNECDSINAADTSINWKTAIFNDISNLIKQYPNIKKIILTSGKCEKYFYKNNNIESIEIVRVISPSSAAAKPYNYKLSEWKININN